MNFRITPLAKVFTWGSLFAAFYIVFISLNKNDRYLTGLGLYPVIFWALFFDPVSKDVAKETRTLPKTPVSS